MPRTPSLHFAMLAAFAASSFGCANVCKIPAAATARPATTHPHVLVLMPLATLERELTAELQHIGPQRLPLPPAMRLLPGMSALSVVVRDIRLRPNEGEGLKLRALLELHREGRSLTQAQATVLLRPRLEAGKLILALRPADLQALRVELSAEEKAKLERELKRVLPAPLRRLVSAEEILRLLAADGYALLRRTLLRRVGELGRFEVALPDVPLQRAKLTSHARPLPHLRLALFTSLPVRRGWQTPLHPHSAHTRIALAGSALAEIGNDAMQRGLLPRRYDGSLRPKKNGGTIPRYDWRADQPRPLKLRIHKVSTPCAQVVLGAKLDVRRHGKRLEVGIHEGRIEEVHGAPLTRLWIWMRQLWQGPVDKTREMASGAMLTLGGRTLAVQIEDAKASAEGLVLDFEASARRRPVGRSNSKPGQQAGRP